MIIVIKQISKFPIAGKLFKGGFSRRRRQWQQKMLLSSRPTIEVFNLSKYDNKHEYTKPNNLSVEMYEQ